MELLGIDIGGTGIKGAPVDLEHGELTRQRLRIPTPRPATPHAVADVVARIVDDAGAELAPDTGVGVTFPGVVQGGVVRTAANLDPAWVGQDVAQLLSARLARPVTVVNDADAAAVAELHFGAAKDVQGTVVLVTFGTGIGTGVINGGILVANCELGHLEIDGRDAEQLASDHVRELKGLSWPKWAKRVDQYLVRLHAYLWPERIVVGGGVSSKADKWLPELKVPCPVVPATLANTAGIVGAALVASGAHLGATAQSPVAPTPVVDAT